MKKLMIALAASLILTACGGGGGGDDPKPATPAAEAPAPAPVTVEVSPIPDGFQTNDQFAALKLSDKGTLDLPAANGQSNDGWAALTFQSKETPVLCVDTRQDPVTLMKVERTGNSYTYYIRGNGDVRPDVQRISWYLFDKTGSDPMKIVGSEKIPDGTPNSGFGALNVAVQSQTVGQKLAVCFFPPKSYVAKSPYSSNGMKFVQDVQVMHNNSPLYAATASTGSYASIRPEVSADKIGTEQRQGGTLLAVDVSGFYIAP